MGPKNAVTWDTDMPTVLDCNILDEIAVVRLVHNSSHNESIVEF